MADPDFLLSLSWHSMAAQEDRMPDVQRAWRPTRLSTFRGRPQGGAPDPWVVAREGAHETSVLAVGFDTFELALVAAALANGHGSPEAVRRFCLRWDGLDEERLDALVRRRAVIREGLAETGADVSASEDDDRQAAGPGR